MERCVLFVGVFGALWFGLCGFGTFITRDEEKKEDQKKLVFELFNCHWYMSFVSMGMCLAGIYTSIGLFFYLIRPNQEELFFIILGCILSVVCFIGLVYSICLIKEYMENLMKD